MRNCSICGVAMRFSEHVDRIPEPHNIRLVHTHFRCQMRLRELKAELAATAETAPRPQTGGRRIVYRPQLLHDRWRVNGVVYPPYLRSYDERTVWQSERGDGDLN